MLVNDIDTPQKSGNATAMKNKELVVFEKCAFCEKRSAKFETNINLLICDSCYEIFQMLYIAIEKLNKEDLNSLIKAAKLNEK